MIKVIGSQALQGERSGANCAAKTLGPDMMTKEFRLMDSVLRIYHMESVACCRILFL